MARGSKSYSRGYKRYGQARGGFGNGRTAPTPAPPQLVAFAHFSHACLEDLICRVGLNQVPYFNAPVYLANRECIGKVDEVFGTLTDFSVSVRLVEPKRANLYKAGEQFFIEPVKLLPMARFLPKAKTDLKPKPKQQRNRKKANQSQWNGRAERGRAFNNRRRSGFNFNTMK